LTYSARVRTGAFDALHGLASKQRTSVTSRGATPLVVGAIAVGIAADVPVTLDGWELSWDCLGMALSMSRLDYLVGGRGGTDGGESSEDAGGSGETHGG
jgi:hypothetical protein